MTARRPLVRVGGRIRQLPAGDTLPGVRELLTAARTYYVRTDGSDSNTGLSNTAGGAFLTIQKAVDVASALDNGGYNITIQLADGTYSQSVVLKSFVGGGQLIIAGNSSTPDNVIISSGGDAISTNDGTVGTYFIKDLRLTATGNGLYIKTGSIVLIGNLVFGACSIHVRCEGYIRVMSSYKIIGGATYHYYIVKAEIQCNQVTLTISGTVNFSGSFVTCVVLGLLNMFSTSISGAATGKRYTVASNSVVFTNGAGANYLPGNSAGTTDSGGLYL